MRKNKGFTLIELMIVIAIIAIIAAIAIPNLLQSRIRANEAASISVIKQIAAAQVQFQVARQGRLATNTNTASGFAGTRGYCDNYRNLFYGTSAGGGTAALALISQAAADAFVAGGAPANSVTVSTASNIAPTGATTPYQGYHFVEPTNADSSHFATSFAIVSIPNNSSRSGTNAYYLGEDGVVYIRGAESGKTAAADYATLRGTNNLFDPTTIAAFITDGWSVM